ncbi:MAG: FAD-binding oxidoreductase [Gammaproteobacteria bacterium]|nr:FAD-binding oxidoreductase [Gammaproteobacteria bacterium]
MRLADYDTEPRFPAKVLRTERITDNTSPEEVRELVLEVQGGELDYKVGQTVGVLIPGPHEFGQEYHHRLYSVADTPSPVDSDHPEITIVVRRCNYIDDYSGEEYKGVSSNYLCNLRPGDALTLTGPFGIPFSVPENKKSNLLLIGLGTGIAPFRGLIKHIYHDVGDWEGKVRLLYGARSGLELLYMNDKRDDFAKYYDEDTFEAIKALSPRPNWADPIAWDYALEDRAEEIWHLLDDEDTYVYVAGLKKIADALDQLLSEARSPDVWEQKKNVLATEDRWFELLY